LAPATTGELFETYNRYGCVIMPISSFLRGEASHRHRAWFRVAQLTDFAVVSAGGELDGDAAAEFHHALEVAASGARHVVIDMSGVAYADSAALGVLLAARARALETGGSVVLVRPPDPARRLLASTVLQKAFPVHETLGEAVDAVHEDDPRPT
jgi:anti-anti-sigma factor